MLYLQKYLKFISTSIIIQLIRGQINTCFCQRILVSTQNKGLFDFQSCSLDSIVYGCSDQIKYGHADLMLTLTK